jgi:hypothetical protein
MVPGRRLRSLSSELFQVEFDVTVNPFIEFAVVVSRVEVLLALRQRNGRHIDLYVYHLYLRLADRRMELTPFEKLELMEQTGTYAWSRILLSTITEGPKLTAEKLSLFDTLSRLTFVRATKLLGADGSRLFSTCGALQDALF